MPMPAATIQNIPPELLLQIFLYIQPHFAPLIDDIFEDISIPFQEKWSATPKPNHSKKFHSHISLSRGRPALLRLGQVSRQFRLGVRLHPFWYSLNYHLLAPFPSQKQFHLTYMIQLSQFLLAITNSYGRDLYKRIDTLYLNSNASKMTLLVNDVVSLLSNIKNPLCVKNLILSLNWLALADKKMIQNLLLYKNLERLYLKGAVDENIVNGFDNSALKLFETSFNHLTHLFIDGFGSRSYTWKRLRMLLIANPNLKQLIINKVRGVVDLKELSKACPNLELLTVHLKAEEQFMAEEVDIVEALRIRRNLVLGVTFANDFTGANFSCLKRLCFVEEEITSWISTPIIHALLKSIPRARFYGIYPLDEIGDIEHQLDKIYYLLPA